MLYYNLHGKFDLICKKLKAEFCSSSLNVIWPEVNLPINMSDHMYRVPSR